MIEIRGEQPFADVVRLASGCRPRGELTTRTAATSKAEPHTARARSLCVDARDADAAAFGKWTTCTQQGARVLEDVVLTAQTGLKTIGEKALGNALANTEATFVATEGLARAKTLPEAARLQAKFVQEQLAVASEQGKALFELSVKVAKDTTDTLTAITTKAVDDLKKVA